MSTTLLIAGRLTAGCVRRCLGKSSSFLRLTCLQSFSYYPVGLRSNSSGIDKPQLTDRRLFSSAKPNLQKQTVTIHFVLSDGKKKVANAKLGDNLLDVVLENDIDIDGYGACEGTLACSTCHLIFKQDQYDKLSNKPTDEELDMLDLAYGLSDTSRLGCQVIVTKEMEGWEIVVPSGVADARSV